MSRQRSQNRDKAFGIYLEAPVCRYKY
ncbi:phage terminase small subunit-related protein [Clostridium pasteurianum]